MPAWFKTNNDPDEHQGEFKPDAFKEDLTKSFKEQLDTLRAEQEEKLKPIIEMANTFKEAQERSQREAQESARRARTESREVDDDLWITNPAEAHRRSTASLEERTLGLAAITMRKEILSDKPYYFGSLKQEIDDLIEAQPLSARANASVLNNAYFTVLGRHSEEIAEGKLKKATFGATNSGNGTGASRGQSREADFQLTDEHRKIMREFNMSEDELKQGLQEMGDYV